MIIKYNQDSKIIFAISAVTSFLSMMAFPTMQKYIVTELPASYIAIEQIGITVSLIVLCQLWNNDAFRAWSLKMFRKVYISEIASGFVLYAYSVLFGINAWVIAIGRLILFSMITVWLSRMIIAFESMLFSGKDREEYDNNYQLVCSVSALLGSSAALMIEPDIETSLFLWALSLIGNAGWLVLYKRLNKRIKEE